MPSAKQQKSEFVLFMSYCTDNWQGENSNSKRLSSTIDKEPPGGHKKGLLPRHLSLLSLYNQIQTERKEN